MPETPETYQLISLLLPFFPFSKRKPQNKQVGQHPGIVLALCRDVSLETPHSNSQEEKLSLVGQPYPFLEEYW